MLTNNKLKVIASSLALSMLLNGCSLSFNTKKDKDSEFKKDYISILDNNMSLEEALAFLESSECLSFFYTDDLTCPIEKTDVECVYKCKENYHPYFVNGKPKNGGMMGISTENGYNIFDVGYHYDQDGNMIPNTLDNAIGVRAEYFYLIEITNAIENLIKKRNNNLTADLKQLDSYYYLVPKNYKLYSFSDNAVASFVKETEKGLVYIINDNDANNFVAVKDNIINAFDHGKLLIEIIINSYYTQNQNLVL